MADDGTERFLVNVGAWLAANVVHLRARAGLSQEELADAAGLAPRHLQKLEAGTVNATLATIVSLAKALHVPPDRLLRPRRRVARARRKGKTT